MQFYLVLVLIFETLLALALLVLLIYKSHRLSDVIKEIKGVREEEKKIIDIQHQRDDYLAMLVHELRAPLAVTKGAADLIMREAQNLSKDQIEILLGQIKKSSSGLLQIVNDILDVSKLESGKFSIKKVDSDLNAVLHEVSDYYLSWANEKQLTITQELDSKVPTMKIDCERIKQVLNNLISNAIKFSEQYGTIAISSKLKDNRVLVEVSDNGIGIPDEMKHKLFNKFVQVPNRDFVKEKGTGLGLFISKGIVEAHGGTIWIEDNVPQGTRFLFTVPILD